MTDTDYLAEAKAIAALDTKIAKAKEALSDLEAKRAAHEKILIKGYEQGELESITVGGRTVYLQRQLWLSYPAGGKADACAALEAAGAANLVEPSFNMQTASAWMRDLPRHPKTDMPIYPKEVGGRLGVREDFKIRTRKRS